MEVAAQIGWGTKVNVAPKQLTQFEFKPCKAEQPMRSPGLELSDQIDVAIGPELSSEGRAEKPETPDTIRSTQCCEDVVIVCDPRCQFHGASVASTPSTRTHAAESKVGCSECRRHPGPPMVDAPRLRVVCQRRSIGVRPVGQDLNSSPYPQSLQSSDGRVVEGHAQEHEVKRGGRSTVAWKTARTSTGVKVPQGWRWVARLR